MSMRTEPARHILHAVKPSPHFFLHQLNMNLYRGCTHGCIYCDSRSTCYQLIDFECVRPKQDALTILRSELRTRRKPGVVATGSMSDPYNPLEEQLHLTRDALLLLKEYGYGVLAFTKSALIARDAALLREVNCRAPVCASLSITTPHDGLSRIIEPNVSVSSERLEALAKLSEAKVFAGVWINPVLPYLTDGEADLTLLMKRCKEAGAKFVMCHFGMSLRAGSRDYYYRCLDKSFPGMRDTYERAFGQAYQCASPKARALYRMYQKQCEALGLLGTFQEINEAMQRLGGGEQLSFL